MDQGALGTGRFDDGNISRNKTNSGRGLFLFLSKHGNKTVGKMSSVLSSPRAFLALLVPIFVAYLYGPSLQRTITVLGALRKPANTLVTNPDDFVTIEDTVYCEDLHYYAPTHSLFTACEDSVDIRFGWFPGLATFHDPALGVTGRGSIHVIDPVVSSPTSNSTEDPSPPSPPPFVSSY